MASLPVVRADNGSWGGILNDFLLIGHNADGTNAGGIDSDTDVVLVSKTGGVSGDIVFTQNATELVRLTASKLLLSSVKLYRDDFNISFGDSAGAFSQLRRHTTVPNSISVVSDFYGQAHGVRTISDRLVGVRVNMVDDSTVVTKTVSGAANNGSGLIRVTCTGHSFATGDLIGVYGVTGTTEANGWWAITVIDANTFDLQTSTFTNAYVSGGQATNRPMMTGVGVTVSALTDRGGLAGTAAHADDLDGYTLYSGGPGKATDGYYIGRNSSAFPSSSEFISGLTIDANVDFGIRMNGAVASYGVDLSGATFGAGAIKLPNNASVYGRKADNSGDVALWTFDTLNELEFLAPTRFAGQSVVFQDGINVLFGTTNGTKLGLLPTHKMAFHGATPVIQRAGADQADVDTTASTQVTPYGYATQAQADGIVTLVNELRDALVEKGLIKGSA